MAGNGAAPKDPEARRRRNEPGRGEWSASPGIGWQHGPMPWPEGALHPDSLAVWETWMQSWFASRWTPGDLPGLSVVIHLYDQVLDYFREPLIEKEYITKKGETRSTWVVKPNPTPELRQMMDNYGITPKGQQDRRWQPPKIEDKPVDAQQPVSTKDPYRHLRSVS